MWSDDNMTEWFFCLKVDPDKYFTPLDNRAIWETPKYITYIDTNQTLAAQLAPVPDITNACCISISHLRHLGMIGLSSSEHTRAGILCGPLHSCVTPDCLFVYYRYTANRNADDNDEKWRCKNEKLSNTTVGLHQRAGYTRAIAPGCKEEMWKAQVDSICAQPKEKGTQKKATTTLEEFWKSLLSGSNCPNRRRKIYSKNPSDNH